MKRMLALGAAVVLIAGAVGCGDDEPEGAATVTVTEPAADIDDAPSNAAETAPAETVDQAGERQEINGRQALVRSYGQEGRDGAITFRTDSVERVNRVPREFEEALTAPSDANLFVATVTIRNDGEVRVDPFCGSQAAVLIDQDGRNFEPETLVGIPGNSVCEGVQPGFRSTERIPFLMPTGARPEALALWDPEEPDDFEAETYVRFQSE